MVYLSSTTYIQGLRSAFVFSIKGSQEEMKLGENWKLSSVTVLVSQSRSNKLMEETKHHIYKDLLVLWLKWDP